MLRRHSDDELPSSTTLQSHVVLPHNGWCLLVLRINGCCRPCVSLTVHKGNQPEKCRVTTAHDTLDDTTGTHSFIHSLIKAT